MTTHAGDPECQLAAAALPLPAAAGDPDEPASMAAPIPTTVSVVVSCVQTGSDLLDDDGSSAKEIACSTTSSASLEVAFPVLPTVSVESDEPQNLSLTWYAPTCASDFSLEWIQFVMKQYMIENNQDYSQTQASNIQQFQVTNMAGSPEDEATKKG